MRHQKFSVVLGAVLSGDSKVDAVHFLAEHLQIPLDKAEDLATRIEKRYPKQNLANEGRSPSRLLEKLTKPDSTSPIYSVGFLSNKEFDRFIGWLFEALGYEIQTGKLQTDLYVELLVTKSDDRIAILALKCPTSFRVTDSVLLLAKQTKDMFECEKSIVISTTTFTEQAVEVAQKMGVELWDSSILDMKILEAKKNIIKSERPGFPPFYISLLQSLLRLGKNWDFQLETRLDGKYDLFLPGVRHPLLTFEGDCDIVTLCVFRIRYNEPVAEKEGEALIKLETDGTVVGPDDETAYESIVKYLEGFLK